MRNLINEYVLAIFSFISMVVGIELLLLLFTGRGLLEFITKGFYGL